MDLRKYIKLLHEFEGDFPTEATCLSYVRDLIAEKGRLLCGHCGSHQVEHVHERTKRGNTEQRTVRCIECRKKTWFTAGTIFERTKKLKPFLAILWFQEHNLPLSSSLASHLLGIAQSTAWAMIKKTQILWVLMLPGVKLAVFVPSEVFAAAIRKRSRETPARAHPRAEIKSFSPGSDGRVSASLPSEEHIVPATALPTAHPATNLGEEGQRNGTEENSTPFAGTLAANLPIEQQRILHALLETGRAVHIDTLSELLGVPINELLVQLTLLEFDKLIESRSMAWFTVDQTRFGYLRRPTNTQNSASVELVENSVTAFVAFCHEHFHGTSRKYLQLYVAQFARATTVDRPTWNTLLTDLVDRAPIPHSEIVSYVSPQEIQMVLQAA